MSVQISAAQRRLVLSAHRRGAVATGGFGSAQHHRPARRLEALGLFKFGLVPLPAGAFVLGFLGVPNGARLTGVRCYGWTLTPSGRRYARMLAAKEAC